MSPAQHKVYKKNTVSPNDITENMALLLEQAVTHMNAVVDAIEQKEVERRFKESERAAFILGGLKSALVRVTPEQSKVADELQSFYEGMETLIMRVNVFNNLESAKSISQSLSAMAQRWRHMGAARQQEALANPQQTSSENFYAQA